MRSDRTGGKISTAVIARAALRRLNDVGLDGLTMRLVARELDVQAPALYWHVKNKQELLDAMAEVVIVESVEGLESPRRAEDWAEWVAALPRRMRHTMLQYRDGARMLAGTSVGDPALFRTIELTLRTMQDAGFPLRDAARAFTTLYHYTVGFTIEEQARSGAGYEGASPYEPATLAQVVDPQRFPLAAQTFGALFDPDSDAEFEHGLAIILAGMKPPRP